MTALIIYLTVHAIGYSCASVHLFRAAAEMDAR